MMVYENLVVIRRFQLYQQLANAFDFLRPDHVVACFNFMGRKNFLPQTRSLTNTKIQLTCVMLFSDGTKLRYALTRLDCLSPCSTLSSCTGVYFNGANGNCFSFTDNDHCTQRTSEHEKIWVKLDSHETRGIFSSSFTTRLWMPKPSGKICNVFKWSAVKGKLSLVLRLQPFDKLFQFLMFDRFLLTVGR